MNWQPKQELSVLKKGPITREDLKAYAGASGDNNPIHLDETFAKQAGFPSVIVHGMLSMAFLADHLVKNFPEGQYRLEKLKVRFRKVTFPGDILLCQGEVKAVQPSGILSISLWATNQKGEVTLDGEAQVAPTP